MPSMTLKRSKVWKALQISLQAEQTLSKHRWFSGRMLACHAGGPGSIPGRCTVPFWPCVPACCHFAVSEALFLAKGKPESRFPIGQEASVSRPLSSLHIHTTGWDHYHSVKGATSVSCQMEGKILGPAEAAKIHVKKTSLYKYSAERSC